MPDPRVVNLRDFMVGGGPARPWGPFDLPPDVVRIDRSTPHGNPYRVGDEMWRAGKTFTVTRELAIELYRSWLPGTLEEDPYYLEPLRGKRLACWDAPEECHGDVIVEWLDTHPSPIPSPGQPLSFGHHRQPVPEAESAPAWAPTTDTKRRARFKRWVKAADA
jgi:hypothetical protein